MPEYEIKTIVWYTGTVEADSEDEAERMGWNLDKHVHMDCVYDIEVTEVE